MSELKPCPFCGRDNEIKILDIVGERFHCFCTHCESGQDKWYTTPEIAIKAWNTRPVEDALRAELAQLREAWQEEHTARVRAEEQLKMAESQIALLREQLEAERYEDGDA